MIITMVCLCGLDETTEAGNGVFMAGRTMSDTRTMKSEGLVLLFDISYLKWGGPALMFRIGFGDPVNPCLSHQNVIWNNYLRFQNNSLTHLSDSILPEYRAT